MVVATIMDMRRNFAHLALVAVALVGCNLQQSYVTPNGQSVVQLAVEEDVFLPLREPTAAEMSALQGMTAVPFSRMPWAQRGDYELEITLVITNVDTTRIATTATINGINEFNRYLPGFSINDDAIVPDFSQWERTFSLMPGERRTITVREEELDEVATDLASALNTSVVLSTDPTAMTMTTCSDIANELVYFANQSGIDARSRPCVPATIPALVGFVLGLRAEGAPGSPAPAVAIEASVRMRDVRNDRLALTGMQWDVAALGQVSFTPPMTIE
jgi:hypothetical protein